MKMDVRRKFEAWERALTQAPKQQPFSSKTWAESISLEPGVYVLWEKETGRPAYVGETTCLRLRMRDLGRRVNHTCRRKLAKKLGLEHATEDELSKVVCSKYVLSAIEIDLGRKELEEYLSLRWARLLNSPGRRLADRMGQHVKRARTRWKPIV
jgi:hypothetical protein